MRGFTAIEIAITLSVIGLLLLISVPNFRSYQIKARLNGETEALIHDLRLAQQLTVAQQSTHLIKLYPASPQKYELIKRTASDAVVKTHLLPTTVSWQDISSFTDGEVIFATTGAVAESGQIVLQNSSGQSSTIDVKPAGYVRLHR